MSDVVELLQELVRIPSVSGEEHACRDRLAAWLEGTGAAVRTPGRNLIAEIRGEGEGDGERALLFCSHTDVVPVGPGWTRDPWDGAIEDGRLHGRGANDAKSSVAAMAVAATTLDPHAFSGRIVLAFVCDEETGGEGIEACLDALPPCEAVVVGEPTALDACPGQRGLLRATLTVGGRACHASRPWEGDNAIVRAAHVLRELEALDLGDEHPQLGRATLQPTIIAAGTRSNVIPGECTIELDGRPTPSCDNAAMLARLGALDAELTVRSRRFEPVWTDVDAEIVALARSASPTGRVRAFGGVSDLFHLRHLPGVVMGPGTSEQSHAPDESVAVEQVLAAVAAYRAIALSFLSSPVSEARP